VLMQDLTPFFPLANFLNPPPLLTRPHHQAQQNVRRGQQYAAGSAMPVYPRFSFVQAVFPWRRSPSGGAWHVRASGRSQSRRRLPPPPAWRVCAPWGAVGTSKTRFLTPFPIPCHTLRLTKDCRHSKICRATVYEIFRLEGKWCMLVLIRRGSPSSDMPELA
jgi:hypothetical protein